MSSQDLLHIKMHKYSVIRSVSMAYGTSNSVVHVCVLFLYSFIFVSFPLSFAIFGVLLYFLSLESHSFFSGKIESHS